MKKSLVLAMAMALGVTASAYAANPFSDVPAGHWAYDSISKLAAAGVIEGYGDDTFRGDRLMTRYEMAQIVAKALAKGANVDKLAAEFADELDALGVRVAALEKKSDNVKITGEIRYHYLSKKKGDAKSHASGLRTRLWFNGKVNDNWTYRARLQNQQDLTNNVGDEETKINYAYLTGRLGGTTVEAGRTYLWAGDGNVYDDALDGIKVSYGKKIRVGAYYGKPTGWNDWWNTSGFENSNEEDDHWFEMNKAYGVNLGFDLGKKVTLDFEWNRFDVKKTSSEAILAPDKKGFNKDLDVFSANLYGKIADNFGLGVIYMHAKSDNEYLIADGASKNGFVVTADVAGAKYAKPGSWGFQAKYYHAPAGSNVAHTMNGGNIPSIQNGYKGYSLSASYTFAKNMMYTIQYYDLKDRQTDVKYKKLWNEVQFRF